MNAQPHRPDAGFTLFELLVAILLLALAVHPLLAGMAAETQAATDRQERLDAARLLSNELASLAAADPAGVPPVRSYRADASGRVDPAGAYAVTTTRTVRCGVGPAPGDGAAPLGCATGGAVADYAVRVTYPRAAAEAGSGVLDGSLAVAASSAYAGSAAGAP